MAALLHSSSWKLTSYPMECLQIISVAKQTKKKKKIGYYVSWYFLALLRPKKKTEVFEKYPFNHYFQQQWLTFLPIGALPLYLIWYTKCNDNFNEVIKWKWEWKLKPPGQSARLSPLSIWVRLLHKLSCTLFLLTRVEHSLQVKITGCPRKSGPQLHSQILITSGTRQPVY